MGSYEKSSCDRSHGKYTICGLHFHNDHKGDWKSCKKCKTENNKVMYDDYATNKFNFEKIRVVKEEIWCRNCEFTSYDLNDFSGKTPCCALDDNYFCKKPACKKVGGFEHIGDNGAFMFSSNNPMAEENQRIMSLIRLRAFPNTSIKENVDELWKEAEKLFQKEKYSPALRCFTRALGGLYSEAKKIEEMEKDTRVKLITLYLRRASTYMKMAEKFGKYRYATLAIEDCDYIKSTESLQKDMNAKDEISKKTLKSILIELKLKADEFIKLKKPSEDAARAKQSKSVKQTNNRHQRNQNRARNQNQRRVTRREQRTGNNNNNNNAHSKKQTHDECCDDDKEIDVTICSRLVESGLAINALTLDDQCPICFIQWSDFVDPSIAVVLPCSHACCATCLLRFQKECVEGQENNAEECLTLSCTLCRKKIHRSTIENVAHLVFSKRLISSLNLLFKKLPFDKQEFEDLVVSLLLNKSIEFDVSKVENSLFNMIGLVDDRQIDHKLNHEEKQKFYEIARAPVQKLQQEYSNLRQKLVDIIDSDSKEWKVLKQDLQDVQKSLHEARKNAASDIFERMNSFGNMGAIIVDDAENVSRVHIDLHGLHINEAKDKVNEYILPILPALKKIIVVTGHGTHAESGDSVLKEAIKQYFLNLNIKCIESTKNKGALCVYNE